MECDEIIFPSFFFCLFIREYSILSAQLEDAMRCSSCDPSSMENLLDGFEFL